MVVDHTCDNDINDDNGTLSTRGRVELSLQREGIEIMSVLAELEGLKVYFYDQGDKRFIRACEDIRFSIREGSVLGVIGESGCGKTVTALSMMGLVDGEPGVIGGRFFFKPKQKHRESHESSAT